MQLTQVQPSQEQMIQLKAYTRYFKNAQIVANDRSIKLEYGSLIAYQTLK